MNSFHRRLVVAIALFALIGVLTPSRVDAQLAPFGPAGVVMGQVHLNVRDIDAHKKFWAQLGGIPVTNGTLQMFQFPGVFVVLTQKEPTAGSVGSTVNHIGLLVKNMQEWVTKWQAAGLTIEPMPGPTRIYLVAPDDVRLEIIEDKTIDVPLKMHHVHFFVDDPLAVQAWYVKTLGAVAGKRNSFDAADLPGVNLTFGKADAPTAKTAGRSLDRIGFEVKGLESFVKNLEVSGVKFDRSFQKSTASPKTSTALLTDPWGTQIELTEFLAPAR